MEKKKRRLLFSVTKADCDFDTFKAPGPGGQHKNKTASAVRVRHRASGAVGQATESRSQHVNKRKAWTRMGESKKFRTWAKVEAARLNGEETVEEAVDKAMTPHQIRTDVKDDRGRWTPIANVSELRD